MIILLLESEGRKMIKNIEKYSMKKNGTTTKIYQEGTRKYIALIMILDGEPTCVQAHWNCPSEFAVEVFNQLTA